MNNHALLTQEELQALLTSEELESIRVERPELFLNVFGRPQSTIKDGLSLLQEQVISLTSRVAELEKQLVSLTEIMAVQQAVAANAQEHQQAEPVQIPVIEEPAPAPEVPEEPIHLSRVETYSARKKKR